MDMRFYPISKDYFKERIYPYLLEFKDGRRTPGNSFEEETEDMLNPP